MIDNVKLLDKTYGKDLEQFEKELELLRKLITTMYHPRTSTMRGMFVKYTGIFKAYYVNPPYNETETKGEHVEIVRRVLHAPVAEVMVELNRKQERLNKRLAKKFHESYDDVVRNVREIYSYRMTNHSTKAMIRLMLACSAACGSRKGENLDPSIEFYTYNEYQEKNKHKDMRIGVQPPTESMADSFKVRAIVYEEKFTFDYVIVQFGVFKDRKQHLIVLSSTKQTNDSLQTRLSLSRPSY